eukprot:scaffold264324_cov14-Tisochrysis_lutea.AAC.1
MMGRNTGGCRVSRDTRACRVGRDEREKLNRHTRQGCKPEETQDRGAQSAKTQGLAGLAETPVCKVGGYTRACKVGRNTDARLGATQGLAALTKAQALTQLPSRSCTML